MPTKLEMRAIQLSVEFTDVDPIEVEKALAHAEAEGTAREKRNAERIARAEAEWAKANIIGVRIGSLSKEIRREVERSQSLNAVAALLYAEKMKAKMERKVARMEAELELQMRREAESRMRKSWSFVNGIYIPKPDEVAHLIQEPILNFR